MFDSVIVPCPSCGTEAEFQSKSGPCLLDTYTLDEVPADVLLDVNRHGPETCKCGVKFCVKFKIKPAEVVAVSSAVFEVTEEEDE